MLANSKLALALSAGLVALLTGCGGGGGGGSAPLPDQGYADTVGGQVTATGAEDNTPTTPLARRATVEDGGRMLLTANGDILVLGKQNGYVVAPTTSVAGTAAGKINGLPPIASIISAESKTYAIARNGEVWGWGENWSLEFASGDNGAHQQNPMLLSKWGTAKDIAVCRWIQVAMILKADGSLRYSPGILPNLGFSTLGTVSGLSKVTRIAHGMYKNNECQFIAIAESGSAHSIIIQRLTESAGSRFTATSTTIQGLPAVSDVSCGNSHCLAQAQDGTVWAWGDNDGGQLGDGTTTGRTVPVKVQGLTPGAIKKLLATESGSMAVTKAGGLVLWGTLPRSLQDKLHAADPNDPWLISQGYHLPYQFYSDSAGISDVVADVWGYRGSYLMTNGDVFSWGGNHYGELGDGTQGVGSYELDATVQALGINLN
jgi:alpha-tubulin suppressor-like RCC1 family protein